MRSFEFAALVVGTMVAGCGGSMAAFPPPCSGTTPVQLTVKNYLAWCSVSVDGAAPSSAASQTTCVASGAVQLTATPLAGFSLGLWHHTTGDAGSGDPGTVVAGTSDATVDASGSSTCVWVCCPTTGLDDCPTTDQCLPPPPPPYMP